MGRCLCHDGREEGREEGRREEGCCEEGCREESGAEARTEAQACARQEGCCQEVVWQVAEGQGWHLPVDHQQPGTYGKPLMLSAVDFTTTAGDKFIGWGFVPASVKALYPKGKKGLL